MSHGQTPLPSDDHSPSTEPPTRTMRQRLVLGSGIALVVVVLVALGGVGYVWYRYNQIGREDLELDDAIAGEPKNFLIVGSDSRDVVDENDPDAKAFLDGEAEQSGRRSDTVMIARVDAVADSVDLVSFPRDLWVPIAGTGSSERINTAYAVGESPQRLIDTIRQNFGITIHHYIEVDFKSFKGIVDAIDGVPMYFQTPMRDRSSGLYVETAGCTTLDGQQALAFARSRHMEYMDANWRWVPDHSADLGRIHRQQVFLRRVIDKAAAVTAGFNLKAMNDLVSSTADNLKVDDTLDLGEMIKLGRHFEGFRGDQLRSHTLPVYPYETDGGAAVLKLDTVLAQPILDIFRGKARGDAVPPPAVKLAIENGSGVDGQAGKAEIAFESLGFEVLGTSTATTLHDTTEVRYPPGAQAAAEAVAEHLSPGARLVEDPRVGTDQIVIVTGTDFQAVTQDGQPVSTYVSGSATSSSIPRELEYTEPVGVVPEAPPDVVC